MVPLRNPIRERVKLEAFWAHGLESSQVVSATFPVEGGSGLFVGLREPSPRGSFWRRCSAWGHAIEPERLELGVHSWIEHGATETCDGRRWSEAGNAGHVVVAEVERKDECEDCESV